MKNLSLAVGVMAVATVTTGNARAADMGVLAPDTGSYFSIAAGLNNISNGNALAPNRAPSAIKFKFHDGLAASGSLGYRFGGLRTEVELSYRSNGVKNFNSAAFPLSGHQDDLSFMANALFDFSTGTRFTPYAGVGVGATMLWWREFANASSTRIVRDTGGTKLAFQAILGLSYALSSEWQVTLDGRYKGSEGHSFEGVQSTADNISGFKLRDTTLMVGVRYNFGR